MKFLHTGDLHLGKTVNDFSMIEEQRHMLEQITAIAEQEEADAVVIAGDIYDRAIPPSEAVTLLNNFLTGMVKKKIPVLIISGNHDSPERVGFADEILQEKGIYISGVYRQTLKKVVFQDEYGEVSFILLPFARPAVAESKTSSEAVRKILEMEQAKQEAGYSGRRVLVTHFFVTNNGKEPELCEGETTIHVGGLDNVEASLFHGFDYVALGHIHKTQQIGEGQIYYAGAPLAYSFSEAGQAKSVNMVELGQKGKVTVRQLPLVPIHQMRRIRGRLSDLMEEQVAAAADRMDYLQVQLTDKEELLDPIGTLRAVYPNIMQIVLMKNTLEGKQEYESKLTERRKSITELFAGFYEIVREEPIDESRIQIIEDTAREAER